MDKISHHLRKLRNGLDPAVKVTILILAILFSKSKTGVVRKRYSNNSFR